MTDFNLKTCINTKNISKSTQISLKFKQTQDTQY